MPANLYPGAMVRVALAPCSPFSVTRELMVRSAELAEKLDVRLHTHFAENAEDDEFSLATFGCRPFEYLRDVGWLSDRTWVAHCVMPNEHEVVELGRAGIGAAHCPSSNLILASGIAPVTALRAAGVHVAERARPAGARAVADERGVDDGGGRTGLEREAAAVAAVAAVPADARGATAAAAVAARVLGDDAVGEGEGGRVTDDAPSRAAFLSEGMEAPGVGFADHLGDAAAGDSDIRAGAGHGAPGGRSRAETGGPPARGVRAGAAREGRAWEGRGGRRG